jgi:hypothetical protein
MKWKGKRGVHLLSDFHDPENVTHVFRRGKDRSQTKVLCTRALADYNRNTNCGQIPTGRGIIVEYFEDLFEIWAFLL